MAQVFTWGLEGRRMSEETATATATDELKLNPPEPVPSVSPEKAAGLVPLSTEQKSKLGERVDGFIDDLVAQDVNSRSEEHTSELQSLLRTSYAVFCLKKK